MRSIDTARNTLLVATALFVFLLSGCGAKPAETPDEGSAELPELPAIGGAQDVWNFPFGFGDDRDTVRAALGDPDDTVVEPVAAMENGPRVEEWHYPGVEIDFYVDPEQDLEYVLSVIVTSSEIELRGGLFVGMDLADAILILGDPEPGTGSATVYFYLNTSIILESEGGTVTRITLSRALP